MRVMILLYLHGFSYIDLGQEEVPSRRGPISPGSPHPVTIVPEQNTSSWRVRLCEEKKNIFFLNKDYLIYPAYFRRLDKSLTFISQKKK